MYEKLKGSSVPELQLLRSCSFQMSEQRVETKWEGPRVSRESGINQNLPGMDDWTEKARNEKALETRVTSFHYSI